MKSLMQVLILSFFIIIAMSAGAQNIKLYESDWKKIDELIQKKNLPKSALAEVKKLYIKAKAEKQDAQIIKALVYMSSLQQENREENQKLAIKEIENELAVHKEPAASILKSLLASLYLQYFQQQRWQLYNRSATVNFVKEDVATWTTEDFHKKIGDLYLQSIGQEKLLQATSLEAYSAIISKGNVRHLRPTLYDLLAHQALQYFQSSERTVKKPAYAFELTDVKAFAPAAVFAAHRFKTDDSLSLEFKALQIYQKLIGLHLKDARQDALIDVDIQRIQFVNGAATMGDKEAMYVAALNEIIARHKSRSATAQAAYLVALYHEGLATQYHPLKDTTHRLERLKARAVLEPVVADSAVKNEGWVNSYNLLQQINKASFSFQIEKVNVPGKPYRALVNYKALTSLNFKVIKATQVLKNRMQRGQDEQYWSLLGKEEPVRSWSQALPQTGDLQEHSVEVKLDALPVGEYILIATDNQSSNKKTAATGAQFFHVSNISYVNRKEQFFVLHRESGQPLNAASVTAYTRNYDYNSNEYTKNKRGVYKTDRNGFFKIDKPREQHDNGYFLEISYKEDHLFLADAIYGYHFYREDGPMQKERNNRVFFFTDRSLYRPGQTVYFKGIAVKPVKAQNSIATGYKTTIHLRDANYQIVDSAEVTTNDFGSFNGKFTLPQNVLNGIFQIVDKKGESNMSFSVEEYKRPKFYVAFEKVKDTYKAGDTVTIWGSAKAYAGNNIDGAKVVYRVVRQPRFVYPWLFWRSWQPQAEPMEIAHGGLVTDANGAFKISFPAIPDKKIHPKLEPVFDYRITADVTDINGETRSSEYIVSAGYKSLLLKLSVAEKLPLDSFKNISIRTENMNGEYQPSTVSVSIIKLLPEQRLIRGRYWEQPDQFIMNKEEFIGYFPNDEYQNEGDYKTWKKGEEVYSNTDSTRVSSQFAVGRLHLTAGHYQVIVTTKDKDGLEVKDLRHVELYDPKSKGLTSPQYLWTKGSEAIEPGEKTTVQIGSSAADVFVVHQVEKPNDTGEGAHDFLKLNSEKKSFEFTATESERGGYGVGYFFIKHNRFYSFQDEIKVPWSNKELDIEFATFRDKTLPGSEEKWTVKIRGYKGEKLAAEMLAGMYDASLDQFKPHAWAVPGIWPLYGRLFNWQSGQNFTPVQSEQKWDNYNGYKQIDKVYDELLFRSSNGFNYARGAAAGRLSEATVTNASVQRQMAAPEAANDMALKAEELNMSDSSTGSIRKETKELPDNNIHIRKNFNETAFFFPELKTDKEGNITFSFTAPEALTRWKLQTLAHTKELAFGLGQKELVTQKELMVQPNAPRFLRQGDRMEFSAKIVNLSGKEMTGQAEFQLLDAATNQPVDGWFLNSFPNQYFTVAAGASEVVKFPMEVPYQFTSALVWRVIARAGNFSDGEETSVPVLTNKLLVTETLPLPMRGTGTKNFTFEKLVKSSSPTLLHHALTFEYTSNPAWFAVQALPYLMETTNESAEAAWNRYYANALAQKIVASSPRIKQIFATWKTFDTAALISNLQKNQELKSALLHETPWVLQAKTETEQKKNIALLFDLVRMTSELKSSLETLKGAQSSNGGFVWMKGAPDDRYMTQYIITGLGRLRKLKAVPEEHAAQLSTIETKAVRYLEIKIAEDYASLIKHKANLKQNNIQQIQIQYLYLRSLYNLKTSATATTAIDYYTKQAAQFWTTQNKYMQGMIALALDKSGDKNTPAAIIRSLKETAIVHEELGMYWKDQGYGYSWFWWQAPIETQALLIEAFTEVGRDTKTVDDLKTWLLKNKQTNNWRTSKATADACYALLLQGTDWLGAEPVVQIKAGSITINSNDQKEEAGTGYFKKSVESNLIKPAMGNISVTVAKPVNEPATQSSNATSWGAVYWQYFEEMDKVTSAATPLQLVKKLFVEKNSNRGPVLTPVEQSTTLKPGDKLKVRIELRVDRDMEYVHMKDLRASALEPVNVLSSYKWQGGLGYYETTKDASTNFFFPYIRKGTYVFEYPLFVTHTGNFSNGITTIQSMYAPEFSAHSEGVRVTIE